MMTPRVSILLPTYNRAEILPSCIESVIGQDFTDWELIIMDDCSDDRTQEVVKNYIGKDPRVSCHRNPQRKGTPANRNEGIAKSHGDLIFFIEDDLTLDLSCLRILVETYDLLNHQRKVGGVMPRLIEDKPALDQKDCKEPMIFNHFTGEVFSHYSITCDRVIETISMHACSLYPKSVLEEVGGYSIRYIGNYFREETDLDFRILKRGYKFYFTSAAFGYHKPIPRGSWKQNSYMKLTYYIIRNHCMFVIRIFGVRALYMIPFYCLSVVYKGLQARIK
ncbi:MAG: glycosyltransferase [Methanoregula sp.]|uniref:glycosyltransferase family 2 protein n=1 Tax=Methanoregula sp. TaxID=2052170 RepID=UPI003C73C7B6